MNKIWKFQINTFLKCTFGVWWTLTQDLSISEILVVALHIVNMGPLAAPGWLSSLGCSHEMPLFFLKATRLKYFTPTLAPE